MTKGDRVELRGRGLFGYIKTQSSTPATDTWVSVVWDNNDGPKYCCSKELKLKTQRG